MNEVKKPKKPLIFYYGVVMAALLLFNLLFMPWLARRQIQEVDYGTFMTMTEDGTLGQVELKDNQILFTDKDMTQVYKTGPIEDPGLVERLHGAGVTFSSEIIEQTSPLLSILLYWILPIVLFIGIFHYYKN